MKRSAICHQRPVNGRSGFTLIELLAVVAIIGILAAIIIPTVSGVRTSAKRAETKVRFSQWGAAMEQFKQEYGYYPAVTTNDNLLDPTKFLAALTGRDYLGTPLSGSALNGNTKAVSFYSFSESEFVKDASGVAKNEITDGFGNSEVVILVDRDGNGMIDGSSEFKRRAVRPGNSVESFGGALIPSSDHDSSTGIRAGVIFYSAGKGANADDIVYSWE